MSSSMVFESPIPIENNRQVSAIIVSVLCIFVTALTVGLRVFAKYRISKPFDASDACIIAALFFNTALHADMFVMIFHGGFSFHVQDVGMRFGPDTLTVFFKSIMSFALLWNATTCFTKLSVLFMYGSIFPLPRMILACRVLGVFVVVWNVAGIIAGMLICRPFAMNWDQTIPGGSCGSQPMYYMALGIINIIVEVTLLVMPFPVLYNLQMPIQKKLVVGGMFGVGFATCGITIYRQVTLPNLEFADMTYSGLIATIFSGLEPSVALALSCVPFLRPYFSKTFRNPKTGYSHEAGSRPYKGTESNSRPFEEIPDDTSEVQLQPVQMPQTTHVTAQSSDSEESRPKKFTPRITVRKDWEVKSEVDFDPRRPSEE